MHVYSFFGIVSRSLSMSMSFSSKSEMRSWSANKKIASSTHKHVKASIHTKKKSQKYQKQCPATSANRSYILIHRKKRVNSPRPTAYISGFWVLHRTRGDGCWPPPYVNSTYRKQKYKIQVLTRSYHTMSERTDCVSHGTTSTDLLRTPSSKEHQPTISRSATTNLNRGWRTSWFVFFRTVLLVLSGGQTRTGTPVASRLSSHKH